MSPPCTTALTSPRNAKAIAARSGPRPIRSPRKRLNVPSSAAKPRTTRAPMATSSPAPGRETVSRTPRQLTTRAAWRARTSAGSDSGRRISTSTQAIVEKPAATRNGSRSLHSGATGTRRRRKQSSGPRTNPRPKAMPIRPMLARPLLGRGHVGHVRLRDQDVAPREAVEHPRQQHHGEVRRQAEDQERDRRPRLADDQQRPAPVPVAEPAEDRARDELAHRVRREEQADLHPGQPVLLGERGQQGHHDAEPEQVDQHDRDDDRKRRHQRRHSSASGTPKRVRWRLRERPARPSRRARRHSGPRGGDRPAP